VRALQACGIPDESSRILTDAFGVMQAAAGHSSAA